MDRTKHRPFLTYTSYSLFPLLPPSSFNYLRTKLIALRTLYLFHPKSDSLKDCPNAFSKQRTYIPLPETSKVRFHEGVL